MLDTLPIASRTSLRSAAPDSRKARAGRVGGESAFRGSALAARQCHPAAATQLYPGRVNSMRLSLNNSYLHCVAALLAASSSAASSRGEEDPLLVDWVHVCVDDVDRVRNVFVSRDGNRAVISYET